MIKVNINTPKPSLDTVRSYKNFEGLMHQYKKYYSTSGIRELLYNDRKKLIYIVIIILFILMLLFADDIHAFSFLKLSSPIIDGDYVSNTPGFL